MDEEEREKAVRDLAAEPDTERLWQTMLLFQKEVFYTAKGLEFTYEIRGYEVFFSRKEKSVTRSTVEKAFQKVQELEGHVAGPKKLGVFGASYLYPAFQKLGLIREES